MDFKLTEEQLMLQRTAREFARKEVKPLAQELDRKTDPKDCFSWELIKKASKLGFRTASLPVEYGGEGLDLLSRVLLVEELATGDAGFGYTMFHQLATSGHLAACLNKKQKEEFLPKMVEDDTFLVASAQTEPSGGTDPQLPYDAPGGAIHTFAERKGNEYIINGTKHFITNGAVAKLYRVFCRTNRELGITKSLSMILVPRGTPGFSIGKIHDKLGLRLSPNSELIFEDARVPARYLIGEENKGFSITGRMRVLCLKTAVLVGTLRTCYEEALEYAKTRVQGGKPIIEHPTIANMLADMRVKIEAGRLLLHKNAWSWDTQHEVDEKMGYLAKAFLTEAAITITRDAVEIFGGFGTDKDMPMEKYLRDVYTQLHGMGTHSMCLYQGRPTL